VSEWLGVEVSGLVAEWVEYLARLRFHIDGFYEDKLSKEYVEREIRRKLSHT